MTNREAERSMITPEMLELFDGDSHEMMRTILHDFIDRRVSATQQANTMKDSLDARLDNREALKRRAQFEMIEGQPGGQE